MSGVETALLRLGVAASNALFASWLRGKTPGARPNESTGDLLRRHVPGVIQRRKAQRQLDQVADKVTEQLQNFLKTEFGFVSENEILAATLLVSDLFSSVETDRNFLLNSDLDAVKIENYLRESSFEKITASTLSEAGTFVFDQVLRETAAYVVEVFTVLPTFSGAVSRELLGRETALAAMVEQVLARLPSAEEKARDRASEDGNFEIEYRRNIARKLDRLELFGVTISEFSRRYALSVAYISLTVANPGQRDIYAVNQASQLSEDGGTTGEPSLQRVEDALGYGRQRVLIRGEAGSGKTTLLQWLSVIAARKEFSGGLRSWNDRIPVYLPLRRFASSTLPRPDEFLDLVLPNLAGEMPRAWMHRLLRSGRGLLLLDGVDELPNLKRDAFIRWSEDLLSEFPNTTLVITSRPAAVEAEWFRGQRVQTLELQPMSLRDTKSLIDHWHSAMAKDIDDDDELRLLSHFRENLKAIMEERRSIRLLATNPLMCALICALHRDRRAQLPRDRMELYRIALEMLLERRDKERQVQIADEINLTYKEKELILEDLAYWLIRNGQSDATIGEASARLEKMLPYIPQVKQESGQVLTYLLERSGVLRTPTEGRVDFLHRSFQEFLAARAAVEGADIPLLIKNGIDDQWREVIVLAAGHARPQEREVLIRGLLKLANSDSANRHRLILVAMSCLETSTSISPVLRKEVENALTRVVPPRSLSDATAIAAAGEVATRYLVNHSDLEPGIVASCVHALALIGDINAMKGIKRYAGDRRAEVAQEIIRSWSLFPAEEYAKEILAQAPLVRGSIELNDSSYADYLSLLTRLRRVNADSPSRGALKKLGDLSRVRHLRIAHIDVDDFTWIINKRLETLTIESAAVYSLKGLAHAPGLRRLSFIDCTGSMLGSLSGLTQLESLKLYNVPIVSLQLLTECGHNLRSLSVIECGRLTSLHGLGALTKLEELRLEDNVGVSSIEELSRLGCIQKVVLRGSFIRDLSPLTYVPTLEVLSLDKNVEYSSLDLLTRRAGLRISFSG